ncbi:TetR/AcrR family transcriptional regulator [Trebonia sp.]|uniref:TetR/AcrR family transcriptional regulator n=1 Tax=Trebonia sp. TaxID=2767075 RepID=UPI002614F79D|nr:TetR/AcrR family transcriptional regulator [Trebonia sp.]
MANRGRRPSTSRDDLLQRVIDYLAGHGIAKATFRSLAAALNISTYQLVYYFGSKEQLLDAVVAEVERRQRDLAEKCLAEGDLLSPWQWCVDNREWLRLDFEILLQEGRESPDGPLANRVFRDWHQLWIERFMAEGLPDEEAEVEATLLIGGVVGLQLDLIATGDVERTTRAFYSHVQQRVAGSSRPRPPAGT